MKKKVFWLVFIIAALVLIALPKIIHLYLNYFYYCETGESKLTSTNAAVQIGYNIIYLLIALSVLLIAYYQLSKTRESTTIQTLSNIDNYIRSDGFIKKRKNLAKYILQIGINDLAKFFLFFINPSDLI